MSIYNTSKVSAFTLWSNSMLDQWLVTARNEAQRAAATLLSMDEQISELTFGVTKDAKFSNETSGGTGIGHSSSAPQLMISLEPLLYILP